MMAAGFLPLAWGMLYNRSNKTRQGYVREHTLKLAGYFFGAER